MTEFTEAQKEELAKILTEIDKAIKETRPKCKLPEQVEILDMIQDKLNELKK